MRVIINGETKTINEQSIAELLAELNYVCEKVAVAVNGEFIPRSNYNKKIIKENDVIDILSAVQGG